jgi:outer membrane cobalamin receptor
VIQIFTRRGQGPVQGDASLTAGTFNPYEGHGTISGGTERFGGSLGVGYVTTTGFLPINNDYNDFTVSKDLITFVSGPGVSFLNVGKAESSGVETGLQVLLPWQLRLDGSYTFLETKVLTDGRIGGTAFPVGQPLLRRAKNQGSVALSSLGDLWTVAFIVNAVGSSIDRDFTQPGSPRVTVPG